MSQPILSVLIPLTPDRIDVVRSLLARFGHTLSHMRNSFEIWEEWWFDKKNNIEVVMMCDNREMPIGEKRELLYKKAQGRFSWKIDSDDNIAPHAVELILAAIKQNPKITCVTFRECCLMDGEYRSSNHSIRYEKWQDNFDGYSYVRCPFYKDVIRTDIAQSVPFEKIRWNEDERWSMAIKPLLIDEIHIDEELYIYIYNSGQNHNERYGIT